MGAKKKPTVCGPLVYYSFMVHIVAGGKSRKTLGRNLPTRTVVNSSFVFTSFTRILGELQYYIFCSPGRLVVPVIAQLGFNILHDWTLQSCTLWHSLHINARYIQE